MAKLSVARINYIKANINSFEPLTYINTTSRHVSVFKEIMGYPDVQYVQGA